MKLNLLSILLLNGFVPVVLSLQPVAPTLQLIKQALSWPDARSYCRATYTDLAPAKTYDDLLKLRDEAARQGVTWPLWVGLYNDIDSWRWSFHDLSLMAIFIRKWAPGEPNNSLGREECGLLKTSGLWIDNSCSNLNRFICYNAEYPGNSRFVGITNPMNWTDAQAYCRRFHTDLASALDKTDISLLTVITAGQGDSWFGLHRDGWTWSDHTKALNVYWASTEPNNAGNENCGMLISGLFYDSACTYGHYFFCHYIPPIKRKMVKLQVRSDENVFDAAVQSALLMKIMKKLEEHGLLEDITATWRVQPDGNVFYKKNDDL